MLNQINILYPLLISIFIFFTITIAIKLWHCKKSLREKDLKLMQFYLDKKFIINHLTKNFELRQSQNYAVSFLENIKFYFKLDEIKIISREELVKDKELSFLFKKDLEDSITSFLSETTKEIMDFNHILNIESENTQRLYIYLPYNKINQLNLKNLFYVKTPYIFDKDESATLDVYIHLAKLFFEQNFNQG